jgi:HSP20 family protein
MAESQTKRSDTSKETGQSVATRGREQHQQALQNRQGGWFGDPFSMMDRIADDMDRSFERMLRDFGRPRRYWLARTPVHSVERQSIWSPRIEAFQRADQFIVRAELPGLKKDDVQVEVTDEMITIRGTRHDEHRDEREGYFHSEREYGEFYRSIPLPEGVITDNAQASFKNGVLEVAMPAPPADAHRGRRLEIKDQSAEAEQRR